MDKNLKDHRQIGAELDLFSFHEYAPGAVFWHHKSDTLQSKIRSATLQKIPYLGIIGDKEIEKNSISIRALSGEDLGILELSQFLEKLKKEIEKKV